MSKANKVLLLAYKKGYRIINNKIIGPRGNTIKPSIDTNGYYRFSVPHNKELGRRCRTSIQVHRLVAYQKYGDLLFKNNTHVRHLDNNQLNNFDSNISIGTPSDNMRDKDKKVRTKASIQASTKIRKFTDEEIEEIRRTHTSYKDSMERWGISSKGTLWYILNNKYVTKK